MKKKLLIIGGVALGIVVIFIILCFTLFGLSKVEVDFRTSTLKLTGLEQEIVESGDFSYGGSVLFMSKKGAIKKIEKEFPYAKVINVETVFPSKYVLHISERQEIYAIENGDQFFITDEEFKVLDIVTSLDGNQAIMFSGLEVANSNAEKGDFLQIDNAVDIYSAFLQNNRALHEMREMIEGISWRIYDDVQTLENGQQLTFSEPAITFKMKNGQTYLIKNCTYALSYKIARLLTIYSNIFDTMLGSPISPDGDNLWTMELLSQATIIIGNKYSPNAKPSETNYEVIPPQNHLTIS